MNREQTIALLRSAETDLVGGDSWLGIIDECQNIIDYLGNCQYDHVSYSLKAAEYLWKQMYPKLESLIYDSRQEPCDKTSYHCHIECDNVSHDRSCWTCKHFEYEQHDDGSETMFCHHDDMRTDLQLPLRDCKLYGETNGELSC